MFEYGRCIIFVGGIHGVGKSHLCQRLCEEFQYEHLVASELIKGNDFKTGSEVKQKRVKSIGPNQNILIYKLQTILEPDNHYLLDGHFTLFDSKFNVQLIPIDTFQAINPSTLVVLKDEPLAIKKRLKMRDDIDYDVNSLDSMQNAEIKHAARVAQKLGIKFHEISVENIKALRRVLKYGKARMPGFHG